MLTIGCCNFWTHYVRDLLEVYEKTGTDASVKQSTKNVILANIRIHAKNIAGKIAKLQKIVTLSSIYQQHVVLVLIRIKIWSATVVIDNSVEREPNSQP